MTGVTEAEVRKLADLARLDVDAAELPGLARDLGTILGYIGVLEAVDTAGVEPVAGVGAAGAPLRADAGPGIEMALPPSALADMREGFFVVPRVIDAAP